MWSVVDGGKKNQGLRIVFEIAEPSGYHCDGMLLVQGRV